MQASLKTLKVINGETFEFRARIVEGEIRVDCRPQDHKYSPLCLVVDTSWRYNPLDLIKAVLDEHGQSFEGEVSFAFHRDYPDDLPPGVTVDYLGGELVLTERMFAQFVLEFAGFYLEAQQKLGVSDPKRHEELGQRVEQLRQACCP
ncbi:MAG: hypothetical protein EHM61_12455 [Acidobacteria bacterium]|nr:MAG: hypothetical protein EHM61_12455 [Acidobacteriota bacterium]